MTEEQVVQKVFEELRDSLTDGKDGIVVSFPTRNADGSYTFDAKDTTKDGFWVSLRMSWPAMEDVVKKHCDLATRTSEGE